MVCGYGGLDTGATAIPNDLIRIVVWEEWNEKNTVDLLCLDTIFDFAEEDLGRKIEADKEFAFLVGNLSLDYS